MAVVTNMSYANIIIRMRDCVRTNIYGQIESVLTRQEPLAPIPTMLQTAFPRKISELTITLDEYVNTNNGESSDRSIRMN